MTVISEFCFQYCSMKKTRRGSEHNIGIFLPNTGTAKRNKLYDRFRGFSGCWINSQWKFPRYQSTSVIPTSSDTGRAVEAFYRIAAPERRASKQFGIHMVYRETFLHIHLHLHQLLILKKWVNGIRQLRSRSIHPQWRKVKGKHEILDRQPKIQSSSVEETLQRIIGKTNNDCRFRISILTSFLNQRHFLAGR